MSSGMIDIYTLVCSCILAVLFLVVICAIVSMIIAFSSDNTPRKGYQVLSHKHTNNGRNVQDGCISQKSVPGGV